MKSDMEKFVEKLYNYFIEHAEEFSDSFEQAIEYLNNRANNYSN